MNTTIFTAVVLAIFSVASATFAPVVSSPLYYASYAPRLAHSTHSVAFNSNAVKYNYNVAQVQPAVKYVVPQQVKYVVPQVQQVKYVAPQVKYVTPQVKYVAQPQATYPVYTYSKSYPHNYYYGYGSQAVY